MSSFTHLHVHTEYSLLDGLSKISQLVTTAKAQGAKALAVTDHGVMYGAIEFYKECLAQEIKPIIGMEAYVSKGDHKQKTKNFGEFKDNNHLLLLAKNFQGYQNLMRLTSIAHIEGFYYKPRFDKTTLAKYKEGLICTSACMAGEIAEYILADDLTRAKETALFYADLFGDGNFYLEIQRHNYDQFINDSLDDQIATELRTQQANENKLNLGLIELSRQLGIPLVATNDVHYIKKDQAVAQDALVCIQTGKTVTDKNRLRFLDSPAFYLTSPEEMSALFPDQPEAISNSNKIAQACNLEIKLGDWFFPKFPIPGGKTASQHLRDTAFEGAKSIYGELSDEIKKRLEYELEVIDQRGYSPYFLIVAEMVNWCKEAGIVTTTRGSAAGSIILYATGITEVDPLKYHLPFERFLNPFRPSPPDIDLDIADNRREDLIAHITKVYGDDKVAQICTFGRMLARGSVRDVGRVLGFPYSFPDKIAKAIPLGSQGFPMTITKALSVSEDLKKMYKSNQDAKQILDLAMQIEGNARHTSIHAAALVISPSTMTDFAPLQKESGGDKVITQYEMHASEDVGLIKFDILGIRNLAILNSAIDIIKKNRGVTIDHKHIPLDDAKTYAMLSRGETMGTFQLSGTGMTRYLMELKPERIEDIMAMIALFRPGPMANIPEYIKRKNNPSRVKYLHPKMKKYLQASYGILVYQEDIMFTALELAGYDWGTVDKLRKAIGKKIPAEMAKQEKIFIKGCQEHSGMTATQARDLWNLFVPFQGYGFNKAHAAAYGIVAYQTAYLKAHYPVEFMTAVLTAESDNTDKIAQAVEECKNMQLSVLPPDINASKSNFTIVKDENSPHGHAIRFGFNAIKNVGAAAIDSIIEAQAQGPFLSLTDFLSRVDGRRVNKKVLESLIKVGAFDAFGKRSALIESLETIRANALRRQQTQTSGQSTLFDSGKDTTIKVEKDPLPNIKEFSKPQLLSFEKELLGLYLTAHPMADALKSMQNDITHKISDLEPRLHQGTFVTLGGIPAQVRTIYTKKNNHEMAFVTLEDANATIDVVFFPQAWEESKELISSQTPILVSGKLELRDEKLNLLASRVRTVGSNLSEIKTSDHVLEIPRGTSKDVLQQIGQLLKKHPGDETISVLLPNGNGHHKVIPLPYTVKYSDELKLQISALLKS